jgi:OmpA-OmpF porin, OOP family
MAQGPARAEGEKAMSKVECLALIAASVILAMVLPLAAQEDVKGSKDYPLFSRWPGYYIADYSHQKFSSFTYQLENGPETVEGEFFHLSYYARPGSEAGSGLEVVRNYENAIRKAGGTVLYTYGDSYTVGRIVREGKEVWIKASWANYGSVIYLDIVERQAMEQTIQANAEVWKGDLASAGHVAIYGINFDTDKAVIKPESEPVLAEMAKLLRDNLALNVFIVGHTDSTGSYEHNLQLSQERAVAVAGALVSAHGIAAARMTAVGVGPVAPVASNDTEDGRAKNRRVELVKR